MKRSLKRFFYRVASWSRTTQDEERLQSEIEEHLALQTEDNIRSGLSPEEARRQAVLKFGGLESARESYRDQKSLPVLETLSQDVRYTLRRLRKAPGFALTTILILALGVGATTSIFTLVHAVLLKSLAVANPNQLLRLGTQARCCFWGGYSQPDEYSIVSYELYQQFRDNTKGFSELAAFQAGQTLFGVRRAGYSVPARSYSGEFVSGNYFKMFGINAFAGRVLRDQDDRPGAPAVAVMSYRLWQEQYASSPSIIGSVFDLDGKPFTIVGITAPGFFGDTLRSTPTDFFVPLNREPMVESEDFLAEPEGNWLALIGRMEPGASAAALQAQMCVELVQWLRSHWADMSANDRAKLPHQTVHLAPGGAGITSMRERYEHWLAILMIVSGFVLLIVCANVANLMLVRGMQHRQQNSLILALGARTSRLVSQAMTESILLSLAGGLLGLLIAFAGTRLILLLAFPAAEGSANASIVGSPALPVLLFALLTSIATGLSFGVAPAWMASHSDPIDALRGGARTTARTGSLPRKMLVVLQAALSLVLLSASGLLTAALHNLETQDFGFNQNRRLIISFDARLAGYRPEQLTPLFRKLHDSVGASEGVSAVALCSYSPLSGNAMGTDVWVDGTPPPGPQDDNSAFWDRVTPGFFAVIGNRIINGRGITEQDTAQSKHVVVINQAFARKYFKGENPVGKYFGTNGSNSRLYEIVGVAKDARYLTFDLGSPIEPFYFLPEAQHDFSAKPPSIETAASSHFLHNIVVETAPGANVSSAQLLQSIAAVDPNLPVISIQPLKRQVDAVFGQQKLIAQLTSLFGLLSLVLAAIGLYGVTAYNAGRRINEIGVRMALGASRGNVVGLILQGAFGLTAVGLLVGLPLSLIAGRLLGTQLYGMNPYDPLVLITAVLTLGLAALLASVIPALRASHISPVRALRSE